MADSEASGKASLDDPVDDPIDTDPLVIHPRDDVGSGETDGEFGYLLDDDGVAEPVAAEWVAPPPLDPAEPPFDAFDEATWNFKPVPEPWYRTGGSMAAIVAVSLAAVALVISVVLLAFRGSAGDQRAPAAPEPSAAPTTATAPASSSELPPPLPPPPAPPPPPAATEVQRAPVYATPARPSKKPEINVTRAPLSVSPQKPKRP